MMRMQLGFKWPSCCSNLCRMVNGGCVVLLWCYTVVYIFVSACGLYWSYGGFQVVVKMGAAFPLILVELLFDLSLLWRLELLLNHWPFFYQKESLFANWGDYGFSGSGIDLMHMTSLFIALNMTWFSVSLDR